MRPIIDSEDGYLRGILAKVKEIEQNPRNYLDWRHLLDETDVGEFTKTVKVLRKHIEKTLETPSEERGEWDS